MIDFATLTLILEATCTVIIFSYYIGENSAFRLGEHVFIGLTAGHALVVGIKSLDDLAIKKVVTGDWTYAIPIIIGLAIYTRFNRNYLWMSRYPYAVLVGVGAGLAMAGQFESNWFRQTVATFNNLTDVNGLIIFVGTTFSLLYFYMSREHTGYYGKITSIGRLFLMLYFGVTFGNITMGRISVTIWSIYGLTTAPKIYVPIIAIVIGVALMIYNRSKKELKQTPTTVI